MHHLATVSFGKKENLPYHAECSCGTAGDFGGHEDARNYLMMHLTRLQGINSSAFVDNTVQPLPVPVEVPVEEQKEPKSEEQSLDEGKQAEAAGE